jgi:opacity protein-like surface antigen
MKKLIGFTVIFPLINLFSYIPGESHIGAKIGVTSQNGEGSLSDLAIVPGGVIFSDQKIDESDSSFAFDLEGSLNILSLQNGFGLDIASHFHATPSDYFQFGVNVRPFFNQGGSFSPYLIVGICHTTLGEEENAGEVIQDSGDLFSASLGIGSSILFNDFISINPSFTWNRVEFPSVKLNYSWMDSPFGFNFGKTNSYQLALPLNFRISENFSVGLEYRFVMASEVSAEAGGTISGGTPYGVAYRDLEYSLHSFLLSSKYSF